MARLAAKAALALVVLGLAPVASAGDPPQAPPPAPDPAPKPPADAVALLRGGLGRLKLGDGLQSDQVILFPLYVEATPAPLDVGVVLGGAAVRASESPTRRERDTIRLENPGVWPVLVFSGTVFEGGLRDRFLRDDVLLPAGGAVDAEVLAAAASSDRRREAVPFKVMPFLAPPYLREQAQFRPTAGLGPRFVSHYLEFRAAGDGRRSLAAVGLSDLLAEYCLVCQHSFGKWPARIADGTVVGVVSVVRGRLQALDAFATNGHLSAFFDPHLRSLSFPAAALELRAKRAGIPIPGKDDPAATMAAATAAARALVARLPQASVAKRNVVAGALGDAFTLTWADGTRGVALSVGGRIVHLAVYPHDPFEYALYAQALDPLDADDAAGDDRPGIAELERREGLGARLTEAERRLLERLRSRNPNLPR